MTRIWLQDEQGVNHAVDRLDLANEIRRRIERADANLEISPAVADLLHLIVDLIVGDPVEVNP